MDIIYNMIFKLQLMILSLSKYDFIAAKMQLHFNKISTI